MTEYGVADLRGKSDQACILAMLSITDARFQDALLREAIQTKKVESTFRIPEAWRHNVPAALEHKLRPFVKRGFFRLFPFGSDFTPIEQRLLRALAWLQKNSAFSREQLEAPWSGPRTLDSLLQRPPSLVHAPSWASGLET